MSDESAGPDLVDIPRHGIDERDTLVSFLDYFRAVLLRKAWGLTDEQLHQPLPPSSLTLGGLLFHMAGVEDGWFHYQFAGLDVPEPWASLPWETDPDVEFRTAPDHTGAELVAQFETSVARSRRIVDTADSLDELSARARESDGEAWSLRWILVHMIEEYARHCGHADYLREAIDGRTGD